jgi:hypothetical protein
MDRGVVYLHGRGRGGGVVDHASGYSLAGMGMEGGPADPASASEGSG